eukprot:CAMPEP_0178924544 /NCGR_PEP_ID=MMETSP0786-20121207/17391_1 /TAXON_ID=186022 /ORGANISM="Thalassionema frauenfeldii, Strain CCMP 1798" /LENGTH=468 /DNA_ID=CAMNT_0020599277 /DNA_START=135 /DNA_END=1538 /DNA_ORIENTATION=-
MTSNHQWQQQNIEFDRSIGIPSWLDNLQNLEKRITFASPWFEITFDCKIFIINKKNTADPSGLEIIVRATNAEKVVTAEAAIQNLIVTGTKKELWGRLFYQFSFDRFVKGRKKDEKIDDEIIILRQREPEESFSGVTYGAVVPLIGRRTDTGLNISLLQHLLRESSCKATCQTGDSINLPFVFICGEKENIRKGCEIMIGYLKSLGFSIGTLAFDIVEGHETGVSAHSDHYDRYDVAQSDFRKRKQQHQESTSPASKIAKERLYQETYQVRNQNYFQPQNGSSYLGTTTHNDNFDNYDHHQRLNNFNEGPKFSEGAHFSAGPKFSELDVSKDNLYRQTNDKNNSFLRGKINTFETGKQDRQEHFASMADKTSLGTLSDGHEGNYYNRNNYIGTENLHSLDARPEKNEIYDRKRTGANFTLDATNLDYYSSLGMPNNSEGVFQHRNQFQNKDPNLHGTSTVNHIGDKSR